MTDLLGAEARAVALLRGRWRLLAVTAVGALSTAAVFGAALPPEDRPRAIFEVLVFGAMLLPMIAGHGMISGDLRSGVALLWLQKPVSPVLFFLRRALEVTAVGVTLVLALWGTGALIAGISSGVEGGRELLSAAPGTLLLVVCVCALLFGFSAWGIPTDTLFAAAFFFASTFSLLAGGPITGSLMWIALPVDPIAALARILAGRGGAGGGEAFLLYVRFVVIWAAFGTVGLVVSTRSPLPREVSR